MDNFFTSLKLANSLLASKTTLLGTMNRQRREMPPSARGKDKLNTTKLMKSSTATLTIYQSKPRKNVCVLSTMHPSVAISADPPHKPETVLDYNGSKWGVDILDQMARNYTVRAPTTRWPVAVFYNILDLAAINAYVLYRQCLGKERLTRREFLQELALQLRKAHIHERDSIPRTPHMVGRARRVLLPTTPQESQQNKPQAAKRARTPSTPQTPDTPAGKKRRQCQMDRCGGNKTVDSCHICGKRACGTCAGAFSMTCYKCK